MNQTDMAVVQSALERTRQIASLEGDDETMLWHLTRSILEWCDAQNPRVDFDLILENVREDFNANR